MPRQRPPRPPKHFGPVKESRSFFARRNVQAELVPEIKNVSILGPALVLPLLHQKVHPHSQDLDVFTIPSTTPRPPTLHSSRHPTATPRVRSTLPPSPKSARAPPSPKSARASPSPKSARAPPSPKSARAPTRQQIVPIPAPPKSSRSSKMSHAGALPTKTSLPPIRRLSNSWEYEEQADGADAAVQYLDSFDERNSARETACPDLGMECSVMLSPDELEEGTRLVQIMFQLHLGVNSAIFRRLRELSDTVLYRRLLHELGNKKQMSRDEFHLMVCRVLRDEAVSRKETMILFRLFDDDQSGLVDAAEFVGGFVSILTTGSDDLAFKYLNTVLQSKERQLTVFISRFELQILIGAAKNYYKDDPVACAKLDELVSGFNFSFHKGRIPIGDFRQKVESDDALRTLLYELPHDTTTNIGMKLKKGVADAASSETEEEAAPSFDEALVADLWISRNNEKQYTAIEHGNPRWYTLDGVMYKVSDDVPNPSPVFRQDD